MGRALDIIKDETLTYRQELIALAQLGESTDHTVIYSDDYYKAKAKGALCDLNEGVMLVGAGLLSKYTFMTDPKYGQGLTPEQAEEELNRIKTEGAGRVNPLDIFNTAE